MPTMYTGSRETHNKYCEEHYGNKNGKVACPKGFYVTGCSSAGGGAKGAVGVESAYSGSGANHQGWCYRR
eukprot:gene7489-15096_t